MTIWRDAPPARESVGVRGSIETGSWFARLKYAGRSMTDPVSTWSSILRATAISALLGAAAIHASVMQEHYEEWAVAGSFFLVIQILETGLALALVVVASSRWLFLATIAISLGTVAIWMESRIVGVPFGPQAWVPEAVGRPDVISTAFEALTAVVLLPLVFPRPGRVIGAAFVAALAIGTMALIALAVQSAG